ncbi:hypothetical protein AWJ19_19425 [Paenibacillus sp. DMB5]|nr:YegP family protein [Paenibacillus sp. DMB5]KUP25819.1 hypothetical protein AWJ19_19425 [Paenibacillus sp. DMB5]
MSCLKYLERRLNQLTRFEIKKSSNSQYYFVLKASNGQILVTSETYTTKESAKAGIQSVRTNAPLASVLDLT